MKFFKLVQGHLVATVEAGTSGNVNNEEKRKTKISDKDL
jgi:hypothetical protein